MAQAGEVVFHKREEFIREFIPIFQSFIRLFHRIRRRSG